jgi:predicted Zn-dependent peptidase
LRRVLVRERASHQLVAGCLARDLDRFQRRLDAVLVQDAVAAAAGRVLDEALSARDPKIPPMEGGPR